MHTFAVLAMAVVVVAAVVGGLAGEYFGGIIEDEPADGQRVVS